MKYVKIQSSHILVTLKSSLSKHKFNMIRLRGNEHKKEFEKFDPYVQRIATYIEDKERKNLKP